jgi:hypothetical protein
LHFKVFGKENFYHDKTEKINQNINFLVYKFLDYITKLNKRKEKKKKTSLCFLREGAPKGMSVRVFPNLRRTHEYRNLPVMQTNSLFYYYFLASFPFSRKEEAFQWEHGNI